MAMIRRKITHNESDYENYLDDEYHKLKDEGEMK